MKLHNWSVCGLVLFFFTSIAADLPAAPGDGLGGFGGFGLGSGPPGLGGGGFDESQVAVTATVEADGEGGPGQLVVTAVIEQGWHLYAVDQPKGGPKPTVIRVADDAPLVPVGPFVPDQPPVAHEVDDIPAWKGLELREHAGTVVWRVPLRVNPSGGGERITGSVTFQLCQDTSCLPPETVDFVAALDGAARPSTAAAVSAGPLMQPVTHVPERGHLVIESWVEAPRSGSSSRTLLIRLLPEEGWHLYPAESSDTSDVGEGKPTILSLVDATGLEATGRSVADVTAIPAEIRLVEGKPTVEGLLTLGVPVDVAADADAVVECLVGFQTCKDTACDPPWAARVRAVLPATAGVPTVEVTTARYAEAAKAPTAIRMVSPAGTGGETPPPSLGVATETVLGTPAASLSLPLVLAMGLAGGLILNLMPCVLPVLGLKLMAFAQQSGRARREVFEMNLWYVAGLFAVFFVLATASVAANLGLGTSNLAWGEQFTSTSFNIVMASIVFAFALSFLGVWEIPIPGFIGEKAGHMQTKEGPLGSFLKGVLSTVLATPCSGPFLGPVFGFTLSQPTAVTYAVFGAIATGMALPYLLVGIFPSLVKFLPKPGAWMETVKEIMGFVMLGTVVFLFTFLDGDYVIPTLGLLFAIWMGCWWIGRGQTLSPMSPKTGRWIQAAGLAGALGSVSFTLLGPVDSLIEWEPFSRARLAQLREEGSTVLVDFSADWCLTCKLNLATAIETSDVKALIDENEVVPLLADWTEENDEIKRMLESLQSRSIPLLAIYPGCKPGEPMRDPIILRDLLTESQVLAAIREAGPSKQCDPEIRAAALP
jgi:suppressor for copper-sensitivity B